MYLIGEWEKNIYLNTDKWNKKNDRKFSIYNYLIPNDLNQCLANGVPWHTGAPQENPKCPKKITNTYCVLVRIQLKNEFLISRFKGLLLMSQQWKLHHWLDFFFLPSCHWLEFKVYHRRSLTTEFFDPAIWLSPKRGLTRSTRSTPSRWFVLKHLAP